MTPVVIIAYNDFPDTSVEDEILKRINARVIRIDSLATQESKTLLSEADALMVSIQPIGSDLISNLSRCKIISRCGTGLDNIDIPSATQHNIWVTNVPDAYAEEVSTHTIALLLACARRIIPLVEATRAGRWDSSFVRPVARVQGQCLGLIGFGHIARATAKKAQAFGLKLICFDPYLDIDVFREFGVTPVEWETLLKTADYISMHTPLTNETAQLIDVAALALIKPTAFLINTARGKLIDEGALFEALQTNRIAGAALDVLATEPPGPSNPLLKDERVIITPHFGWYSEEAVRGVRVRASEEVVRILRGELPQNPANHLPGSG